MSEKQNMPVKKLQIQLENCRNRGIINNPIHDIMVNPIHDIMDNPIHDIMDNPMHDNG